MDVSQPEKAALKKDDIPSDATAEEQKMDIE